MSATSIRGKEWVFNAFWAACGEPNAPKCMITIPITCILKDGKPFKTLYTDDSGLVKRVMLEDIQLERTDADRGFRGESFRMLRTLRHKLIEYALNHKYVDVQEQNGIEPIICNVRMFMFIYITF
jgi:hypothetical protein